VVETARIDQHDRTMDTGVAAIALLIGAYWDNLNDSVNRLFDNPVTASGLRSALLNQLNRQDITVQIQTVLDDQLAMLGYEDAGYTVTRDQLSNTSTDQIIENNNNAFEALIAALTVGIIAGSSTSASRTNALDLIATLRKGVTRSIQETVIAADSAYGIYIMRDRGVARFTYKGGIVSGTREFCAAHNNKTYSEREIRNIWSSQSWGGKKPGDPFVTRGGYNCRHYWVPAEEE